MAARERTSALLGGLLLAAAALAGAALSVPAAGPSGGSPGDTVTGTIDTRVEPAFAASCIGYCQHPTNAAKVFRWGLEDWRQEFETGSLSDHWHTSVDDAIGQQQGMLTIKAASDSGTVRVWPDDQSATTGRWESRVRAFEKTTDGTPYRFTWELVPVGADACQALTIVLASYVPGDEVATGSVTTLPDHQFTFSRKRDLRSRAWHTYAVEVTPTRISWFVDTKVMRTERRPEVLSGLEYRPQFVMEAVDGSEMRESWMQMDWVRYYTLKRPNAKPVKAPPMDLTTLTTLPTC
ncbi:family 16 glycosylhydrolase [Nocardioides luti]|nr:family 16 glycosylhydrolase [Nocardioides luti]